MSKVTFGYIGNSGEPSATKVHIPDLTAANFDNSVDEGAGGVIGDLKAALDAITLMNNVQRSIQVVTGVDPGSLPSEPYAQREIKLYVSYIDTVTAKKYSFTVPGPDLSLIAQTGTDIVDHTSNVLAIALTTQFEANCVSPDGNAVAIHQMRLVGRNV